MVSRRLRRTGVVLAVALSVTAPSAGAAVEERIGASIDVGEVEIRKALLPGGTYSLPRFGVRNPGTARTSYRIGVSSISGQSARPVPAGWFRFSPGELTLAPGETEVVATRLSIPADAEPDDYAALIGPEVVTEARGATVGAGAAARLAFEVEPSSLLQAWWLKLKTFLGDYAPWTYVVPALMLAAAALLRLRGRFTVTVARRA